MLLSTPLCEAFTDELSGKSSEMVKAEFYDLMIVSYTNATKYKHNGETFSFWLVFKTLCLL